MNYIWQYLSELMFLSYFLVTWVLTRKLSQGVRRDDIFFRQKKWVRMLLKRRISTVSDLYKDWHELDSCIANGIPSRPSMSVLMQIMDELFNEYEVYLYKKSRNGETYHHSSVRNFRMVIHWRFRKLNVEYVSYQYLSAHV